MSYQYSNGNNNNNVMAYEEKKIGGNIMKTIMAWRILLVMAAENGKA